MNASDAATTRRTAVERAQVLLDEFENRDVVWTITRMRYLQGLVAETEGIAVDELREEGESSVAAAAAEKSRSGESAAKAEQEQEWKFLMNVLRNESGMAVQRNGDGGQDTGDGVKSGIGKNIVAMRLARLASRVFEKSVE